jgi:hypothetical protein
MQTAESGTNSRLLPQEAERGEAARLGGVVAGLGSQLAGAGAFRHRYRSAVGHNRRYKRPSTASPMTAKATIRARVKARVVAAGSMTAPFTGSFLLISLSSDGPEQAAMPGRSHCERAASRAYRRRLPYRRHWRSGCGTRRRSSGRRARNVAPTRRGHASRTDAAARFRLLASSRGRRPRCDCW